MSNNSHFQAIVMAGGKGSRMTDISNSKPKCLLPIGNYPMVYYPLSLLKKIGFTEVIVIVQESAKSEVAAIPKKYDIHGLNLDIVTLPPHEDYGTADALRRVHEKIHAKTVFVLSCDLFTDLQVHQLLDIHRIHDSSVTALFTKNLLDLKGISVPGPKTKVKRERDLIGIDISKPGGQQGGQICFWNSEADLDSEEISLKRTVMQEHPQLKLFNNLIDAHFYIFDKWVIDFIVANDESFSSIKGEVIPYLVKKQFSKSNIAVPSNDPEDVSPDAKGNLTNRRDNDKKCIEDFLVQDDLRSKSQHLSSWNDHIGDMKDAYRKRSLKCFAYIMEGGTCIRANTMQAYCELNRQISNLLPSLSHNQSPGVQIHPNSSIQPKAQVGFECFVGEGSTIADKTTIKNCIIGSNCQIHEKVRLTNCIIMDNVTIRSLNNINGSILSDGVETYEKCELKDCIVSKGHSFNKDGENRSNEVLGADEDKMMEI